MARMRNPGREPSRTAESDDKRVEVTAVRLLARREHGTHELKRKLTSKGYASEAVDKVVQKLGAKKLLADDRFVASFVRHHAQRGQGPVRIRAELRQQGVEDALIQQGLADSDSDWDSVAAQVRQRKFGRPLPASRTERAKQARFLQYRGFNGDQIRAALANDREDGLPEIDEDSTEYPLDQD